MLGPRCPSAKDQPTGERRRGAAARLLVVVVLSVGRCRFLNASLYPNTRRDVMEADTYDLREVFLNQTRYLVPLFQRKYCWEQEKQLEPLWDDVINLVESQQDTNVSPTPHFLGAIVLTQVPTKSKSLNTREIIDGQQRLTTLQILIAAFRDVAKENNCNRQFNLLKNLTFNNADIISDESDLLKIYPTNVDRDAFEAVMKSYSLQPESLITRAYHFFVKKTEDYIRAVGNIAEFFDTLTDVLLGSLKIVLIDLDSKENPQVIFEVLNARGEPLQPSDLIKNTIFVMAKHDNDIQQDNGTEYIQELHDKYWSPFDKSYWGETGRGRPKQIKLDRFFSHYLTMRQGFEIRRSALFVNFRDYINAQLHKPDIGESFLPLPSEKNIKTTKDLLKDIQKYSEIYKGFEHYPLGDHYELFFYKLDVISITTIHPFLLYLFGLDLSVLSVSSRIDILKLIESYVLRRMIVGLTPKNYNKIFLRLLQAVVKCPSDANNVVRIFLAGLSGDSQLWPDDESVISALENEDLHRPYRQLGKDKVRIILESIEGERRSGYREDQRVPRNLTIEHIMPRQWKENWPLPADMERDEAERRREERLHRLGNLTLVTSEFNSSLSNDSWQEKRTKLQKHSKLELNSDLSEMEYWDEEKIDNRSRCLAEVAIKIWPGPPA